MKKNISLLFLSLILIISVSAQSNNISTTSKWGSQIFISDANGRSFENKYADIQGSAYFFPGYKFSAIELTDGRKYINIKAKLNLVEHETEFVSASGQEGYLGKGMVKRISFSDTTKKEIKNYVFESGFPKIDNQSIISFYQVLVAGKCQLLKSINKNIEDRNNELSGEKSREFIIREELYVQFKGEFKRVKKDKEFFLTLLADQAAALNKYIGENKPNFKNEDQLSKLIAYYNSL